MIRSNFISKIFTVQSFSQFVFVSLSMSATKSDSTRSTKTSPSALSKVSSSFSPAHISDFGTTLASSMFFC